MSEKTLYSLPVNGGHGDGVLSWSRRRVSERRDEKADQRLTPVNASQREPHIRHVTALGEYFNLIQGKQYWRNILLYFLRPGYAEADQSAA